MDKRIALTRIANYEATEQERDAARATIWKEAKPIIVKGKPGTGKNRGQKGRGAGKKRQPWTCPS